MASPQKNNPTTTTDDGSSCVICFEHIELENKAVIKICAHAFCFTCIKSWYVLFILIPFGYTYCVHPIIIVFDVNTQFRMDTTITCPLCKQTIDVLQHSFTSGTYRNYAT